MDVVISSLVGIFVPESLLFLVGGTLLGLTLDAIPVLGGLIGLGILIPFYLQHGTGFLVSNAHGDTFG